MISCILLTAGESIRFGSPKALADIKGVKAIELIQQKLISSVINEIIVVTGAFESLIKPHVFNHSKVRIVHNKDHKFGQTSSFQKGLNIVDKHSNGVMLLPVDCPFISLDTIDTLINYFQEQRSDILIPTYQGKRGHPPIFNSTLKTAIQNLPHNKGLNSLISQFKIETKELNDPGIVWSFNTRQELEEILKSSV